MRRWRNRNRNGSTVEVCCRTLKLQVNHWFLKAAAASSQCWLGFAWLEDGLFIPFHQEDSVQPGCSLCHIIFTAVLWKLSTPLNFDLGDHYFTVSVS